MQYVIIPLKFAKVHLAKQWHTPKVQFNQQQKQMFLRKGSSYVLLTADNMGNAYLTSFFVGGAWDHTKLHHSVKAYQNAEKDKTMSLNPDLYYNCATADKYLENYERALRGFEAASLKDPGLGADREVQKIISLLDKLENAMKVCKM